MLACKRLIRWSRGGYKILYHGEVTECKCALPLSFATNLLDLSQQLYKYYSTIYEFGEHKVSLPKFTRRETNKNTLVRVTTFTGLVQYCHQMSSNAFKRYWSYDASENLLPKFTRVYILKSKGDKLLFFFVRNTPS